MILTCDKCVTNVYNIVNSSVLPAFCCCLFECALQMYLHSLRQPEWSGAPFLTAWFTRLLITKNSGMQKLCNLYNWSVIY